MVFQQKSWSYVKFSRNRYFRYNKPFLLKKYSKSFPIFLKKWFFVENSRKYSCGKNRKKTFFGLKFGLHMRYFLWNHDFWAEKHKITSKIWKSRLLLGLFELKMAFLTSHNLWAKNSIFVSFSKNPEID